jgi:hypothetical protein
MTVRLGVTDPDRLFTAQTMFRLRDHPSNMEHNGTVDYDIIMLLHQIAAERELHNLGGGDLDIPTNRDAWKQIWKEGIILGFGVSRWVLDHDLLGAPWTDDELDRIRKTAISCDWVRFMRLIRGKGRFVVDNGVHGPGAVDIIRNQAIEAHIGVNDNTLEFACANAVIIGAIAGAAAFDCLALAGCVSRSGFVEPVRRGWPTRCATSTRARTCMGFGRAPHRKNGSERGE